MRTALEIIGERLDVLAGTRTRDKMAAAVRIEDLIGILQVPQKVQATKAANAAGATPTQAEYNALVASYNNLVNDITKLETQLSIVAAALHKRLTP